MNRKTSFAIAAGILALSLAGTPNLARAQQAASQQEDGVFFLGSLLVSVLYLPIKLVTCVGTQATAAVAYAATNDVAGNYDGGTNGKQIGEVARGACAGSWVITPEQIKRDYQ